MTEMTLAKDDPERVLSGSCAACGGGQKWRTHSPFTESLVLCGLGVPSAENLLSFHIPKSGSEFESV